MRAVIFGTGYYYERFKTGFQNMEIVGFLDNNSKKWNTYLDGIPVSRPENVTEMEYDYIFLVSIHYREMRRQLLALGVPENKIVDEEHLCLFENLTVTESYIYPRCEAAKKEGKRVLLVSHALNLTGAPVVLCRLAQILKKNDYEVTMYTEKNSFVKHGELLYTLLQQGVSVVILPNYNMMSVDELAEQFDVFWVNTITLYRVVERLIPFGKKVYWWLHETDDLYEEMKDVLRFPKAENLFVFSGGWMAGRAYEKFSGLKLTGNLMYGIPDLSGQIERKSCDDPKIRFGLLGIYCDRKGQDVLFSAIAEYGKEWEDKADFLFVGVMPEKIKEKYEEISNVHCVGELPLEKMSEMYESLDVLICASKFDPMPVVVTEAMQHGKVCLVTDAVGQCKYITNGVDGLVCASGDKDSLASKINWAIENKDKLDEVGKRGYAIYAKYFSMEAFENNVMKIMR